MRKFTTHPDQDYDVQMCRNCSHPGGLHVGERGCLCGFCGGWNPGGMGRWSDRMTDELDASAGPWAPGSAP